MQREIRKFSREIAALKKLETAPDENLDLSTDQIGSVKNKILLAIAREPAPETSEKFKFSNSFNLNFLRYAVLALLVVSMITGTSWASASANPGEFLYPLKRVNETINLTLTVSPAAKANLQAKYAEKRLLELTRLTQQNQSADVDLKTVPENSETIIFDSDAKKTPDDKPKDPVTNNGQREKETQINRLERKIRQDADQAVFGAINALEKIEQKLHLAGKDQAALEVRNKILNLDLEARNQKLERFKEKTDADRDFEEQKPEFDDEKTLKLREENKIREQRDDGLESKLKQEEKNSESRETPTPVEAPDSETPLDLLDILPIPKL